MEVALVQPAARTAAPRMPEIIATAPELDSAAAVSAVPAPVASAPTPVPKPKPKPKPEPQRQQQLCADTTFFTRSACVYRECAKPAHAALPMCVEHRRHVQQMGN